MMTQKISVNKKLKLHFFLLLAACILGTFLSGPPFSSMQFQPWLVNRVSVSMISIFPLLFFIPTVVKPTVRSVSWLGFFLLAYLIWAIMRTFTTNGFIGGLLISTFNLTTFFYVVVWLRPFKKIAKANQVHGD